MELSVDLILELPFTIESWKLMEFKNNFKEVPFEIQHHFGAFWQPTCMNLTRLEGFFWRSVMAFFLSITGFLELFCD